MTQAITGSYSQTIYVDGGTRRMSEMAIAMKHLLHDFSPPACFRTTIEMRDSDEKISITFDYVSPNHD